MANVVLVVLSMTIGFFFILMGTLKLTPSVNEDVYREMVRELNTKFQAKHGYSIVEVLDVVRGMGW